MSNRKVIYREMREIKYQKVTRVT